VPFGDADNVVDYAVRLQEHLGGQAAPSELEPLAEVHSVALVLATASPTPAYMSPLRIGGMAAVAGLRTVAFTAVSAVRQAADLLALSGRVMQARPDEEGMLPQRKVPRLRWGIDRRLVPLTTWDGRDRTAPAGEHSLIIAALTLALCNSSVGGGSSAATNPSPSLLAAATSVAAWSYMHHLRWARVQVQSVRGGTAAGGGVPLRIIFEPESARSDGESPPPPLMLIISTRVIVCLPWTQGPAFPAVPVHEGDRRARGNSSAPEGTTGSEASPPQLTLATPTPKARASLSPQASLQGATAVDAPLAPPGPSRATGSSDSATTPQAAPQERPHSQWWSLRTLTAAALQAAARSALDPQLQQPISDDGVSGTAAAASAATDATSEQGRSESMFAARAATTVQGLRRKHGVGVEASAAAVRARLTSGRVRRRKRVTHAGLLCPVVTPGLLAGHMAYAHILDATAEILGDFDYYLEAVAAPPRASESVTGGTGGSTPTPRSAHDVLGPPTEVSPTVRLMRLSAIISTALQQSSCCAASSSLSSFGALPPLLLRCKALETLPESAALCFDDAVAHIDLLRPDAPPDVNIKTIRDAVNAITTAFSRWCAGRQAWLEARLHDTGGAAAVATDAYLPDAFASELERFQKSGAAANVLSADEYIPAIEHCVALSSELPHHAPALVAALATAWLRHTGDDLGIDAPPVLYFRSALLRAAALWTAAV
jgi:hypothetical protein